MGMIWAEDFTFTRKIFFVNLGKVLIITSKVLFKVYFKKGFLYTGKLYYLMNNWDIYTRLAEAERLAEIIIMTVLIQERRKSYMG